MHTAAPPKTEYDLVVVGGGSGGLACAREAAQRGASVALVDYVDPSPRGTTWGLGGTCVNVGCIPKKLFHLAGGVPAQMDRAAAMGWNTDTSALTHDWKTLSEAVTAHIRSLNFGYRANMMLSGVDYLNARASFVDTHRVALSPAHPSPRVPREITGRHFVIATGTRPAVPVDVPGAAEFGITSDDLWTQERVGQRVLVVGASYVALECAGMLRQLGRDVDVMVRSILLRGMDQQMAEMVGTGLESIGVNLRRGVLPTSVKRVDGDGGDSVVHVEHSQGGTDEYDAVLFAIGRTPNTAALGLEAAGVETRNGFIVGEQTTAGHVRAVGDVVHGNVQLTPTAIADGVRVAQELTGGASVPRVPHRDVATTVFTPHEYSMCGLSEEDAVAAHGEEHVDVFHAHFTPLSDVLTPAHTPNAAYVKAVVERGGSERVLGLHVFAPHAGEIMQGFAVAMRMGLTWPALRHTVGIHPTNAEELVTMHVTKRSGEDPNKTGC